MRMGRWLSAVTLLLVSALSSPGSAATYRIEKVDKPAPSEGVSAEIAKLLAPTGIRVVRGTSRTVCEIWLCKQWPVEAHKPQKGVNYPFRRGQLIGLAHYPRKGGDFRDQPIDEGLYTLRYELQPVDGDHVGTSPTRDFLLVIAAAEDKTAKDLDYENLVDLSAEAVGTSHPGMLALKPVAGDGKSPSIRHDEDNDWWIVRLKGKTSENGQSKDLVFDLVVVGYAEE